ncbi:rod shape-determining protein MreD [Cohnella endophytica]|uniref:Rod shape-determining protein MreD n=1 Tax=Cohnella endophytica TaxID=2419778 RepID=A0A494XUE5_9BACL|nr:rod shape-determining protein MreD [Cohnella endophytica]RKP54243.1 rod shape-determining protein MreD [Cohnella endophytica]
MKIRINWVILCAIILLVLENSIVPWLVPPQWSERLLPHLCFILTLFVAGFGGRHVAFMFGLGFGLLQDSLAYGHLIGPYGFGMGLIGYLAGLLAERKSFTIGFFSWVALVSGLMLDSIVYFIYKLFRLTDLQYAQVFYWQIAPTALLQLLIALLFYVPIRRYLVKLSLSSAEDSPE